MNSNLDILQPYPFAKLKKLLKDTKPADKSPISLSIGEPKHPTPEFIKQALIEHVDKMSLYPLTGGIKELAEAIGSWLLVRFKLPASAIDLNKNILPVNGTREALFALAQAVLDNSATKPLVISPNPFYQIYEGATLLAGGNLKFLDLSAENDFKPDFGQVDKEEWARCQLLYICSPNNPTGSVLDIKDLQKIIALAIKHNFIIAADECYSEIYPDENNPPPSLLQAAVKMGHKDFKNCIVFHSLSKRSNVPGLRSGFVAGDADIIAKFLLYRTYHGSAMPPHHQYASVAAWKDEVHVVQNRQQYNEKFDEVLKILEAKLEVNAPEAGFYLWAKLSGSDTDFTKELFSRENVAVLPGSFLSREVNGFNPGSQYIRMALVAPLEECVEAANRISGIL